RRAATRLPTRPRIAGVALRPLGALVTLRAGRTSRALRPLLALRTLGADHLTGVDGAVVRQRQHQLAVLIDLGVHNADAVRAVSTRGAGRARLATDRANVGPAGAFLAAVRLVHVQVAVGLHV